MCFKTKTFSGTYYDAVSTNGQGLSDYMLLCSVVATILVIVNTAQVIHIFFPSLPLFNIKLVVHAPDCIGHLILDSIQPHNGLGFFSFLLCRGLLLQLCSGWALRWFLNKSHGRSQILVYNSTNRYYINNAGIGMAVLFRRCASIFIGSCTIQTANAADTFTAESRYFAYTINEAAEALDSFRLCVCASGRFWPFDYIGENHEKTAESRVQYTVAWSWEVAFAFWW